MPDRVGRVVKWLIIGLLVLVLAIVISLGLWLAGTNREAGLKPAYLFTAFKPADLVPGYRHVSAPPCSWCHGDGVRIPRLGEAVLVWGPPLCVYQNATMRYYGWPGFFVAIRVEGAGPESRLFNIQNYLPPGGVCNPR